MGPTSTPTIGSATPDKYIATTFAETLILKRKIVERWQDIKRNAQVLLELIRDYWIVIEDE
jgi:hypothetical protein